MARGLVEELKEEGFRQLLLAHPFFHYAREESLDQEQVTLFLSQYYLPIEYFTHYLSRLISVTPAIEMQTHLSRILWQELGEGNPDQAHLTLYKSMMEQAGFDLSAIIQGRKLPATKQLVQGYKDSTTNYLSGLGYLYGTEVIDLTIVSGLGEAVHQISQAEYFPWVDIHVKQEPNHVDSSEKAMQFSFTPREKQMVRLGAKDCWRKWYSFFSALQQSAEKIRRRKIKE